MVSTTINLLKKAGAWQGEYELINSKKNGRVTYGTTVTYYPSYPIQHIKGPTILG
jgi:hypothetical protein